MCMPCVNAPKARSTPASNCRMPSNKPSSIWLPSSNCNAAAGCCCCCCHCCCCCCGGWTSLLPLLLLLLLLLVVVGLAGRLNRHAAGDCSCCCCWWWWGSINRLPAGAAADCRATMCTVLGCCCRGKGSEARVAVGRPHMHAGSLQRVAQLWRSRRLPGNPDYSILCLSNACAVTVLINQADRSHGRHMPASCPKAPTFPLTCKMCAEAAGTDRHMDSTRLDAAASTRPCCRRAAGQHNMTQHSTAQHSRPLHWARVLEMTKGVSTLTAMLLIQNDGTTALLLLAARPWGLARVPGVC